MTIYLGWLKPHCYAILRFCERGAKKRYFFCEKICKIQIVHRIFAASFGNGQKSCRYRPVSVPYPSRKLTLLTKTKF